MRLVHKLLLATILPALLIWVVGRDFLVPLLDRGVVHPRVVGGEGPEDQSFPLGLRPERHRDRRADGDRQDRNRPDGGAFAVIGTPLRNVTFCYIHP